MSGFVQLAAPLLFTGLLAGYPVFSGTQDTPEGQQPIRVKVERVNVGVVVTDSDGRFVDLLKRENFHVFDRGVEQPLTNFATIDEPAEVLLLIESGPAVYLLEQSHLRAAYSLLSGLAAGDRVALVKYTDLPKSILDFTVDKQSALGGLDQVQFSLGFGLLNLSSSLGKVLEWMAASPGKKSVILLSTGVDTSTRAETAQLLGSLSSGDVRVFPVSLAAALEVRPERKKTKKNRNREVPNPNEKEFAAAREELKQIAAASGGRAYFPLTAAEFEAVYAEIAQLVRHEYSLAFLPPALDGKFHDLSVQISLKGAGNGPGDQPPFRVSHRQGYLAAAPH